MADVEDLCSPVVAAGHQQVAVDWVHVTCCHLQDHSTSLMLRVAELTQGCTPRGAHPSARHKDWANLIGDARLTSHWSFSHRKWQYESIKAQVVSARMQQPRM